MSLTDNTNEDENIDTERTNIAGAGSGSVGCSNNGTNPPNILPPNDAKETSDNTSGITASLPNDDDDRMFFTTSDLMKKMNDTFASVMGDDDNDNDDDKPSIELQRRLPDGTTKRADEFDLAAADLQSKIKQAAQMTSNLSPDEKIQWAKEQRVRGNALYGKGNYKEAMDVYITCLVGMDDKSKDDSDENTKENDGDSTDDALRERKRKELATVREIKLPVLLNLSLCAIQLKMGKKAEQFCNFALESLPTDCQKKIEKTEMENSKDDDVYVDDITFASKAYFRRAKARIIMGKYISAKSDLELSLEMMQTLQSSINVNVENNDKRGSNVTVQKEIDAVKNELRKLNALQRAAVQNKRKHEKAVRVVLGGETATVTSKSLFLQQTGMRKRRVAKEDKEIDLKPLLSSPFDKSASMNNSNVVDDNYSSENSGHYIPPQDDIWEEQQQTQPKRAYSTLRSKKKKYVQPPTLSKMRRDCVNDNDSEDDEENNTRELNCFQWFLSMIISCLQYILYLLGDDPDTVLNA
mmetsp:Transcript_59744/g.88619  ORF Transcript_59744/g.88619 Transcript_59744/m.88619 type:complete len:524 (-) Transcript_59744:190-1761(-)